MLDKLKTMYGDNLLLDIKVASPQDYLWFQTSEGTPFAIKKSVVTENEKALLTLSFKPFNAYLSEAYSDTEQIWSSLLFGNDPVQPTLSITYYQFIHFHCKQAVFEKDVFNEALLGFFPLTTIVLWHTNNDGVIILQEEMDDSISFDDIIDSITSDLYIDMFLYIGIRQHHVTKIKEKFSLQENMFLLSRKISPKNRTYYHQSSLSLQLILMWIKQEINLNINPLIQLIEQEDDELLTSIQIFLESNMNISIASKRLYVHRNSLQYRIDKFHENTGLNPKDFQDAMTIHLLIFYKKIKGVIKDIQMD